jgi:hypothetical protein
MSSVVVDEHITDNSSVYEVLDSYSSKNNPIATINNYENTTNINDLIDRIVSIVNERLDNAQQCKNRFNENSMKPAIYQVLCEIKDKIGKIKIIDKKKYSTSRFILVPNTRQLPSIDDQPSEQLMRVDNMLQAEGITERYSSTDLSLKTKLDQNNSLNNSDYRIKLSQIKQIYNFELEKYENHCNHFCSHVRTLLREQSQIRPISEQEIERMVMIIRKKFSIIQLQLKQSTCEAVMILRSRFLDARFENFI